MKTFRDDYFTAYRSLKLTRAAEGVLVAQFHDNGGPLTFTAEAHTEVVDAFYRISQDRANKNRNPRWRGRGLHDRCRLVVIHQRVRPRREEPDP